MKIDRVMVTHVAKAARLNLTEEDIMELLPQLKEILEAFSSIKEVDTENIEPALHPVEIKVEGRQDVPEKSLSNEEALLNTLNKKDGYFKGPKVI